jgi:hypothetical protein
VAKQIEPTKPTKPTELIKTNAAVQVRLSGELFQRLEQWRGRQPKIPPRSIALRELLERALSAA